MLYRAKTEVVGKRLDVNELHARISKHIKQHLPVRVTKRRDTNQTPGVVYMGGMYHADYDHRGWSRYIEIVLSYHTLDDKIKITDYRWRRMCNLFADTMLHELIHVRQYRSRNFKDIPGYESTAEFAKQRKDQTYYGDKDEMGAFSFNIACEMVDRFGLDYRSAMDYMDSNEAKKHKRTSWHRYLHAFDWNHNHKIIRKMKKKVRNQLENAYVGKPFKTTDHLTY
jgi:hypothetical protein